MSWWWNGILNINKEYKQCNVLKPGGEITLWEKVKDFQKKIFFGVHENQEEKPTKAATSNHGTVNPANTKFFCNLHPLMVLKAAYFRSNPKHTGEQLLEVFLSTELDHLQAEVTMIFQKGQLGK